MSVLDRPVLIPVRVGACRCAGAPHPDGDFVSFPPDLSLEGGQKASTIIAAAQDGQLSATEAAGQTAAVFLDEIVEWTFVDDEGTTLPINHQTVKAALPWNKGGQIASHKAGQLYMDSVTDPFLAAMKQSTSPSSRTASSTRRSSRSSSPRRKPSKPSSGTRSDGPQLAALP